MFLILLLRRKQLTRFTLLLHTDPELFKKLRQHITALLLQHPSGDLYLMVKRIIFQNIQYRSGAAPPWGSYSRSRPPESGPVR